MNWMLIANGSSHLGLKYIQDKCHIIFPFEELDGRLVIVLLDLVRDYNQY